MPTTSAFQRNARRFKDHLSSLLTRTITDQPLVHKIALGQNQALIYFRDQYAEIGETARLSIFQRIGASTDDSWNIVTHEYSYSFILGPNPDIDWLVRYDYVPEEAAAGTYRYPVGHVHLNATSTHYTGFMAPLEKKPLHQVHFPTGRIGLEDFIEHLIIEFHLPTHGRDEQAALAILSASRRMYGAS